MYTEYQFNSIYDSTIAGSEVGTLPTLKNNTTIGAWVADNDYAFDGTIPDKITGTGTPSWYKVYTRIGLGQPTYNFMVKRDTIPDPMPSFLKVDIVRVWSATWVDVKISFAVAYQSVEKTSKYNDTIQMNADSINNLLSDITNILSNNNSLSSQAIVNNKTNTVPCTWTKVREETYTASSPQYGKTVTTKYTFSETVMEDWPTVKSTYPIIPYDAGLEYAPVPGKKYTSLAQTTATLSGKTSSTVTKKVTVKNSASNIYVKYYYKLGTSTGSNIAPSGSQHILYIEAWDGDPTSASSKQLYSDSINYPQYMPNIGGNSTLTKTNRDTGTLYISASDNHVAITSKWKNLPTSITNYYYTYLISKFAHTCPWLDTNSKPLVGIKIYPQMDSMAYTGRFYNPFDGSATYASSARFDMYSQKTLGDTTLIYVDSTNTKQFILLPILIKSDDVGVFGNVSTYSNVYNLVGVGKTTIKDGNEITLADGSKYIKFKYHAVKVT
jgi:hypothetical protein